MNIPGLGTGVGESKVFTMSKPVTTLIMIVVRQQVLSIHTYSYSMCV